MILVKCWTMPTYVQLVKLEKDELVKQYFIPDVKFSFPKKILHECNRSCKQKVEGLQAFAFPVETVYDEHAKSRFKRKLGGQIYRGHMRQITFKALI